MLSIDLLPLKLQSNHRKIIELNYSRVLYKYIVHGFLVSVLWVLVASSAQAQIPHRSTLQNFFMLLTDATQNHDQAFKYLDQNWHDGFVPMFLETLYLSNSGEVRTQIMALLQKKTKKDFGFDLAKWNSWMWNKSEIVHSQYADFKSILYSLIDPKFEAYFDRNRITKIRLDEVMWGGVLQDGIPPLRKPNMVTANEQNYLDDNNIVFGIEINGDARAYPKRILAWHEMFVDTVGNESVTGVYCTLCGTLILYHNEVEGVEYQLGTSGFLYRSNKLMYDKNTNSLWNTIWGKPVIGPLAAKHITLKRLSVVTTTWGEWKSRHPESKVLDINTGYQRDYGEGVAYHDYFSTDKLMFGVPKLDNRLNNKDEILGLIFSEHADKPLAVAADYLLKHTVYHDKIGGIAFVVLTDASGANRVYETKSIEFISWDQKQTITDKNGGRWQLTEASLQSTEGKILHRLPAHRAFWFGWYSAYSHTKLIF